MDKDKKNRQSIIEKILNIMEGKLKIDPNLLNAENYNKPLTGNVFNLTGLDLAYLFFEVEKSFGIKIETKKILSYEFNDIQNIAELIMNCGEFKE